MRRFIFTLIVVVGSTAFGHEDDFIQRIGDKAECAETLGRRFSAFRARDSSLNSNYREIEALLAGNRVAIARIEGAFDEVASKVNALTAALHRNRMDIEVEFLETLVNPDASIMYVVYRPRYFASFSGSTDELAALVAQRAIFQAATKTDLETLAQARELLSSDRPAVLSVKTRNLPNSNKLIGPVNLANAMLWELSGGFRGLRVTKISAIGTGKFSPFHFVVEKLRR